jgi:CheY-like chemotaxis protein
MSRILAIDDEVSCLEILEFSLKSKGHEIHIVNSGQKAIEFLKENAEKIDLILLDMMMPEMNGTETLKRIKEIEGAKNIPVIFQTGTSNYSSDENAKELGNQEYILRKPYKRDELLEMINTALCVTI